jgi:hypothetical protein
VREQKVDPRGVLAGGCDREFRVVAAGRRSESEDVRMRTSLGGGGEAPAEHVDVEPLEP